MFSSRVVNAHNATCNFCFFSSANLRHLSYFKLGKIRVEMYDTIKRMRRQEIMSITQTYNSFSKLKSGLTFAADERQLEH